MEFIEVHDKIYKVLRTLNAEHINQIDGWRDVMCRLYKADTIYQKGNVLYVVESITDVEATDTHGAIPSQLDLFEDVSQ